MGKTPAGKLVNMLSNDLQRFDTTSNYLHYIWIMPIQAVAAFYVMYQSVGIACLAGMIFMAIEALPLQGKTIVSLSFELVKFLTVIWVSIYIIPFN